jgi:hypothetical protein
MKKFLLLLIFPIFSFAQSYIGLHTDNYKGVHGVLYNPASIVNSPFKTDVNIIGTSILADNDIYNLNANTDFDDVSLSDFSDNSNLHLNTDFLGPSFLLNINKNNSIALFTRVRAFFNGNGINGEIFDSFFDDFSDNPSFDISENGFNLIGHSWGEIGVSYATVLLDKPEHKITAGASFKYLRGIVSASISSDNFRVAYNSNDNTVDTSGELTYYSTVNVSDDNFSIANANGFGADIGFTYEWRNPNNVANTNNINDYTLKFGLSIMDIGHIKYKMFEHKQYIANAVNIDESIFDEEDLQDAFDDLYTSNNLDKKVKLNLPTSMNLQADWNVNNKIFVNLYSNISLVSKTNSKSSDIVNQYIITPRFETKIFTAQLPFTYSNFGNLKAGFGLRVGSFYVGSGSLFTNLMSSKSKSADAYIGIKIPIYK